METVDPIIKALEAELVDPPNLNLTAGEKPAVEFVIDNREKAEWVVSKFVALEHKYDLLKRQYNAIKAEVTASHRYLEWRFKHQLAAWTADNLEGDKKSIKLLTGTVAFVHQPQRIRVTDDAACIKWARDAENEVYKITESIDKMALNDHYKKTGEIPPGCEVEPEEECFYVRGGKTSED